MNRFEAWLKAMPRPLPTFEVFGYTIDKMDVLLALVILAVSVVFVFMVWGLISISQQEKRNELRN